MKAIISGIGSKPLRKPACMAVSVNILWIVFAMLEKSTNTLLGHDETQARYIDIMWSGYYLVAVRQSRSNEALGVTRGHPRASMQSRVKVRSIY